MQLAMLLDHGDGPPRVWLHGFAGSARSWDAVLEKFDRSGRVYGVNLPGHEQTATFPQQGFSEVVRDLATAIRVTIDRPIRLVGYSLGGRIALGLAVSEPSLVEQLTLISVNPGLADQHKRQARIAADQRWVTLLRQQGVRAFSEAWQAQPLFSNQKSVDEKRRNTQHRVRTAHDAAGLALAMERIGLGAMPDYTPMLASLAMPVLLITGALDEKFALLAERMATQLPHGEHRVIPACGHNPLLEHPELLADHLR